ncbi:MAG: UBP-type zinc finger domain-containing protein [Chloroflexi bacterium]|jgi:uncharacterized UBP type Zn finger protein|nr:UBP-type zinc finger domain-containing protein [Chloroflexota bacterium]
MATGDDNRRRPCVHLADVDEVTPRTNGCEECLEMGDEWFHLRLCTTCGHVGCCDNSKNRHATKHYYETGHPVIKSFEPGEDWGYCFADEKFVKVIAANAGKYYEQP